MNSNRCLNHLGIVPDGGKGEFFFITDEKGRIAEASGAMQSLMKRTLCFFNK